MVRLSQRRDRRGLTGPDARAQRRGDRHDHTAKYDTTGQRRQLKRGTPRERQPEPRSGTTQTPPRHPNASASREYFRRSQDECLDDDGTPYLFAGRTDRSEQAQLSGPRGEMSIENVLKIRNVPTRIRDPGEPEHYIR